DGEGLFPIGARHIPLGVTLSDLRRVGFNAFRWTAFGVDRAVELTPLPKDMGGLMFYPYVFTNGDLSCDVEPRRHALSDLIHRIQDHPALLCYEQRNEPAYTHRAHAAPQSPPDGLIAGSQFIRALDPNHPIRVGHMVCNLVSTLRRYNEAVDIVGCNPYVISPPGIRAHVGSRSDGKLNDSPNQTLSAVGDFTSKMMRVGEGRAVWMQLQASANENWFNPSYTPECSGQGAYEYQKLYPSFWQMRFMAFHAIVRGATALEWMLHGLEVESNAWQDLCRIINQLSVMQGILCSPPWRGELSIRYRELGFSDWTGVETLVRIHNGQPWIIAVNSQFDPMDATISCLPNEVGPTLEVVFENRSVEVSNESFRDWFQPYEVHIYRPINESRLEGKK
ncbi:MAG: hypothetical protein ACREBW_05055, partial [Candidatus Micrarchaeaceae archaeon]